ncbi:FkbM family methyltransferase [Bradyrhizobium sp. RT6a]|jgi:FkbM family methyltransferase|uniref:FkbM family methyltransferase n=1 Tax=unclassified Bradyrhizobium TaxID=2631580 RepID=UPI003391B7C3
MLAPNQPLGWLLRLPLQIVSPTAVARILMGPNRGLKWVVGAGNHSCWLGTYERVIAKSIAARVKPGMTVFDVGAHAGYYTLMLSRLVGHQGRVFAFEANPENAKKLRRHLHINRVKNVELIEAAVSDQSGMAFFEINAHLGKYGYMGTLAETGIPVQTVVLDDFPVPDLIKMDIEGAETRAFVGASRLLSEQRTAIFLALHDQTLAEAPAILKRHNFLLQPIAEREMWAMPARAPDK